MARSSKPTIVIVPGAWHTPKHFDPFIKRLTQAGYRVLSQKLPSVGSREPNKESIASDADFIRRHVLLPELDRGSDIVVIMHSYGGCTGPVAARGLSKKERRAAGLRGGIVGLIFISAFVLHEGQMPQEEVKHEMRLPPYDEEGQVNVIERMRNALYGNVPDSHLVDMAFNELKPQSYASLTSPSPPPAWADDAFDGRLAYVFTHQDKIMPLPVQRRFISGSGKAWRRLELEDSDHSPFLSRPEPLHRFVDQMARDWTGRRRFWRTVLAPFAGVRQRMEKR